MVAKMMRLFAIFPLDQDLAPNPMCIKGDGLYSLVVGFRSVESAKAFITESLHSDDFRVAALTLDDFDRSRQTAKSRHGLESYVKVFD